MTNFKNTALSQPEFVFKIGVDQTKIHCFTFSRASILSLGYQALHTTKQFLDEIFLETFFSKENVYLLDPPTWFCVLCLGVHVFGPLC